MFIYIFDAVLQVVLFPQKMVTAGISKIGTAVNRMDRPATLTEGERYFRVKSSILAKFV